MDLLFLELLVASCGLADADWFERTESHKHYYFSDDVTWWQNARDNCKSNGGYLSTINGDGEFEFLTTTYSGSKPHWIGLYRTCERCNDWRWIQDNETREFFRWDNKYPLLNKIGNNYVVFRFEDQVWRNVPSDQTTLGQRRNYICEVDDACFHPSRPCKNSGQCTTINRTSYHCFCNNTGYRGDRCQNDVNECRENTHECQNGGLCVNIKGSYRCNCQGTGYKGKLCSIDVNECNVSNPCRNGSCLNTFGSCECFCYPGYTGELCETDINECHTQGFCSNGECKNFIGGFLCDCPDGFYGYNCEHRATKGNEKSSDIIWMVFVLSVVIAVVSCSILIILIIDDRVRHRRAKKRIQNKIRSMETVSDTSVTGQTTVVNSNEVN